MACSICMRQLQHSVQVISSLSHAICYAGYAHPILDVLDPTGKLFTARLYRDATTATLHHSNVKVQFSCRCAVAAVSTHTAAHLGLNQPPQSHLCMLCTA